jgi:hypothetical protein
MTKLELVEALARRARLEAELANLRSAAAARSEPGTEGLLDAEQLVRQRALMHEESESHFLHLEEHRQELAAMSIEDLEAEIAHLEQILRGDEH